jgi:hypothetical protein
MLAELPDPADDGQPDQELLEALSLLHHENPVKAAAWPFEDYIRHAGKLGEFATHGILKAVMANGVSLSTANAQKSQVATMTWWARTGGCAHFWHVVRPVFDQTITLFLKRRVRRVSSSRLSTRLTTRCLPCSLMPMISRTFSRLQTWRKRHPFQMDGSQIPSHPRSPPDMFLLQKWMQNIET